MADYENNGSADKTETLSPAVPNAVEALTGEVLSRAHAAEISIATAESCTGGLLASLLTDVDGLGHCFERGVVSYSNKSKNELLGVPLDLIEREGAVSRAVAIEMARGALARSEGGIAVSITGFAGRGAPGDEPGLVHFGRMSSDGTSAHREEHFGDIGRGKVRIECLRTALEMLLEGLPPAA